MVEIEDKTILFPIGNMKGSSVILWAGAPEIGDLVIVVPLGNTKDYSIASKYGVVEVNDKVLLLPSYGMKEYVLAIRSGLYEPIYLPTIADATVNCLTPDTNYGTEPLLYLSHPPPCYDIRPIFMFDVTRFAGYPDDTIIHFYFFVDRWGGLGVISYYLHIGANADWDEETVTWNNKPIIGPEFKEIWPFSGVGWQHFVFTWGEIKDSVDSNKITFYISSYYVVRIRSREYPSAAYLLEVV